MSVSPAATRDEGFSFRSGRLALDFAATLMFRGSGHPRELLDSPARLVGWAFASGVVSAASPDEARVLREATSLREAIYRTAVARIAGHPALPGDIAVLNRHGAAEPVALALGPDGMITRSGAMPAVLATIARDAIELLGGPDAAQLRQCGRSGCTRMFIDQSRGQNRTWCGMRECGNRMNAAAYRRRRRQEPGATVTGTLCMPIATDWLSGRAAGRSSLATVRVPQTQLWQAEVDDSAEVIRDFLVADVFTDTPLEGNQLGIFPDGRDLSHETMLKATREMNFSETVFFVPPHLPEADAHVRIFTPGGEIPFAGHPTLGSAWVLAEMLGKSAVTLQTGAGPVPVELEREGNKITFGWMSQPIPDWGSYDGTDELLDALGAAGQTGTLPVEWYRNGPLNAYVEIAGEDALAALKPDMQKLGRIPVNCSCFTQAPHGWTTRVFCPALAVPEDPATGSAAGPLAVHLARHGRIKFGAQIEIRQGARIHRPSVLYARVEGAQNSVERVLVGGQAVVVARGEYRLA